MSAPSSWHVSQPVRRSPEYFLRRTARDGPRFVPSVVPRATHPSPSIRCADGAHSPPSRFRLTYMRDPSTAGDRDPFSAVASRYAPPPPLPQPAPVQACGKATNGLSSLTRGPRISHASLTALRRLPSTHASSVPSPCPCLPGPSASQPASADSPRKAATACKPQCTCMSRLPCGLFGALAEKRRLGLGRMPSRDPPGDQSSFTGGPSLEFPLSSRYAFAFALVFGTLSTRQLAQHLPSQPRGDGRLRFGCASKNRQLTTRAVEFR